MSPRAYEFASEINLANKEFIKIARRAGIVISSHMQMLDDEVIKRFKDYYNGYLEKKNKYSSNNILKVIREDGQSLSDIAIEILKERNVYEPNIKKMREYYFDNRLCLVLGAGISAEHGIPGWNTLLQRLLLSSVIAGTRETKEKAKVLSKVFTEVFSPDALAAARFLNDYYKISLNDEGDMSFEEAVRDVLYDEYVVNHESKLYKEILQLCIAPGKAPNLDSIITYNFDDILEEFLDSSGIEIPYSVIYYDGINAQQNQLPIYHVHGYLPRGGELGEENKIIFSEQMYHRQYLDLYSWNNFVQVDKFKSKSCLFIGCSFTDPNLRRLLDIAKKLKGDDEITHYTFKKVYEPNEVKRKLTAIIQNDNTIEAEKSDVGLEFNETVNHMVELIKAYEESDMTSLGVEVIWINDYQEIPQYLKRMRKKL